MSEISDRYTTIATGFEARLGKVGPDQWSLGTPCTDWTVRDLVAHVVGTHRHVGATLGGDFVEVDREEDLVAAFTDARASVQEALADPGTATQITSGMFGEQSFESLVGRLLSSDTMVHTWDLARATGQDELLDPHAVDKTTEFLAPIDAAIRRPGGFAPKTEAPPDADRQTVLLCFCGRRV